MTESRPLRAVCFDLDGLMFNTEELYQLVGTELLRRRGKLFEAELLQAIMGRPTPIALQMMIDWHRLEATVAGLQAESEIVFDSLLDERLQMMPGLAELLEALEAAPIPKAIATGSSRRFASNVLGRFELEARFEFLLTSDEVASGKPDPDIYLEAAERLGVSAAQMLVLEDGENGCKAALASGAFTVAVPNGLTAAVYDQAHLVAHSLADPRIYAALGLAPPANAARHGD